MLSLSPEWRTSYERRFGEILWSFCLRTSSTMWKEPTLGITCWISAVACGAQQDHSPLYSIQSAWQWQWHSKSPIYQSAVSRSAQPNPYAELEKREGQGLGLGPGLGLGYWVYCDCHCHCDWSWLKSEVLKCYRFFLKWIPVLCLMLFSLGPDSWLSPFLLMPAVAGH